MSVSTSIFYLKELDSSVVFPAGDYVPITAKKYKTNVVICDNEERKMTYICRWCDNSFEESGKKPPETEFREGVLCCPRCGNITYGFLVYNEGKRETRRYR